MRAIVSRGWRGVSLGAMVKNLLVTNPSPRFNIVEFNPKPRDFTPHNFICERRSPAPPNDRVVAGALGGEPT